jgi:hypothetical protein
VRATSAIVGRRSGRPVGTGGLGTTGDPSILAGRVADVPSTDSGVQPTIESIRSIIDAVSGAVTLRPALRESRRDQPFP